MISFKEGNNMTIEDDWLTPTATIKAMMIRIENYFLVESIDDNGMAVGFMNDEVMGTSRMEGVPIVNMLRDGWIVLDFKEDMSFDNALKIAEEYRSKTLHLSKEMLDYKTYLDNLKNTTTKV